MFGWCQIDLSRRGYLNKQWIRKFTSVFICKNLDLVQIMSTGDDRSAVILNFDSGRWGN